MIDHYCPRLAQFVCRTPTLRKPNKAHIQFNEYDMTFSLLALGRLNIKTARAGSIPRISSIVQICSSFLDPLSTVEDLYIERQFLHEEFDIEENTLWLQLLVPFTAVKNLYLSKDFVPGTTIALQELIGGRITEVLPSLQNTFVDGHEPLDLPGKHWAVCCRTTALRPLYDHFYRGRACPERGGGGTGPHIVMYSDAARLASSLGPGWLQIMKAQVEPAAREIRWTSSFSMTLLDVISVFLKAYIVILALLFGEIRRCLFG